VVVTSPHTSRAKEGVALALARSLAGSEGRTLLVDADLRHTGSAHGLDPSTVKTPPLEVYLENPDQPHAPAHLPAGGRRVLDFVPSFTAATQPVELLQRGFGRLIEDWRERYDAIVIDAPPLLPFADTLAVAPWSSGVVLCAAQRWSRRDDVVESLAILHDQGIPALGTVLTRAPGDRRRQVAVRAGHPVDDTEAPPADPYVTLAHPRGMQKVRVKER
jgi:polysaccharide biosynthesis transport protein